VRIRLLSVGKPREALAASLHDDYARRLERLGVRYQVDHVADVKPGGRFTVAHAREREARALLERIEATGTVVALDEQGEMLTSRELAERIESWCAPRLTLVIGGPCGLDRTVLDHADLTWSLSRLTFPHELCRALVAEQLYRAVSIRRGTPYHR
jgi:23S rRNA (pseudouridine1915-N3)-methyltransferase